MRPVIVVERPSWTIDRPLPLLADPRRDIPCTTNPRAYDEDQPMAVKQQAAKACRLQCAQLAACEALLPDLGHSVGGVVAGVVLPKRWRHNGAKS
jgi:hypothetical protein